MQNRIITIIGLGHIGGSFAAAIREKGLFGEVWGLDKDHASVQTALRRGLIDGAPDWQQAIQQSDLILLATPVHVIPVQLLKILDEAPDHLVITDVGSTKGQIEQQVKDHPRRGQYVAAHPMAGTEHRGIEAAMADLFQGKFVVLCEKERSSPMCRATGGRVVPWTRHASYQLKCGSARPACGLCFSFISPELIRSGIDRVGKRTG
jgi:prephenate dehydrogenase